MVIKSETNQESSLYGQFYQIYKLRERVTGILSARRERSERLESLSLLYQDLVPPLPFSKKSLKDEGRKWMMVVLCKGKETIKNK